VIRDAVLLNQGDEIGWGVASHGGLSEMRIGGEEVFDAAVEVGEVAAAATGDQNFLSQSVGMFEHGDAAGALAGFDGAHQSSRATSEDDCIEGMGHEPIRGIIGSIT